MRHKLLLRGGFKAEEIPARATGCDGIYNLYKVSTNLNVGKIYGDEGLFMPAFTGESLSMDEMREIISIMKALKTASEVTL